MTVIARIRFLEERNEVLGRKVADLEELNAYAVDAVDQRSRPVRFEITDGCNGKYCIRTEHDEVYVDKRDLTDVQLLIAEESAR